MHIAAGAHSTRGTAQRQTHSSRHQSCQCDPPPPSLPRLLIIWVHPLAVVGVAQQDWRGPTTTHKSGGTVSHLPSAAGEAGRPRGSRCGVLFVQNVHLFGTKTVRAPARPDPALCVRGGDSLLCGPRNIRPDDVFPSPRTVPPTWLAYEPSLPLLQATNSTMRKLTFGRWL